MWPCPHFGTSLRETDYLDRGVTHDGDQLLQSVALIEVLSGWLSNQPETVRYELIGVERAPEAHSPRTTTWTGRPGQSEPGSPWQIGLVEDISGRLRDEVSDREIFHALGEAQVLHR